MKNETIEMKNCWEDVTLNEFQQIDQIRTANIPVDMMALNLVSILCGKSVEWLENQRITFVTKLTHMIDFLAEDIVPAELKKEYEINGHIYELDCDISNITTAKYMDYQNYMKEEYRDQTKIASIWLVPKGHKYNDGYDIEEVYKDMGEMKMPDYKAIVNFLMRQSAAFILVSADCFKPTRKEMKQMTPKKKLAVEKMQTLLHNMAYSLWCSGCAK